MPFTSLQRFATGNIAFHLLFSLFLCSLVLALYSQTLRAPFYLDDIACIQYNQQLQIKTLSLDALREAAFAPPVKSRPIANISFALDYYFQQQLNPVSLHLTNIVIHLLNGIFLYAFIVLTLTRTPVLKADYARNAHLTAAITAVLWAINPLQIQSVTYIVQRMNSLATLFYLLAFIAYILARTSTRPGKRYALSGLCLLAAILAFGSKENSITLPLFILLYDLFFFQHLTLACLKKNMPLIVCLLLFAAGVCFWKFGVHLSDTFRAMYAPRDFTLAERLLTQPRIILFYLSLFFYPHPNRLNLEHDPEISTAILEPFSTLPALLLLLLATILPLLLFARHRLLCFALLWLLGNLALESSIIPLEMIFEHRMYLPSMALALLTALLLVRSLSSRTLLPVAVVLTLLLSWGTYERNSLWTNKLAFLLDCVKKSPAKARPHVELGEALLFEKKYQEAVLVLEKGVALNPSSVEAINSLGVAHARTGNRAKALAMFTEALRRDPSFTAAKNNLEKIK